MQKDHNKIQRVFYPGDIWLYYKIYGGENVCDLILCKYILPLTRKLKQSKLIKQWFFIRYYDNDYHLRLRFQLLSKDSFQIVNNIVIQKIRPLCNARILHDIVICPYSRELERYGYNCIELTENIFCIDSKMISEIVGFIRNSNENYRWMISMYAFDSFLNTLGKTIVDKYNFTKSISESYKSEFGYNQFNSKQLNSVYRKYRSQIAKIIDDEVDSEIWVKLKSYVDKRNTKIIKSINNTDLKNDLNISAIIHMSINRLFPTKNRLYEMVIYDFLSREYKSTIVKLKINQKS